MEAPHKAIVEEYLEKRWEEDCIPLLCDYIKIPNLSPAFDPDWEKNGLLDQAMDLLHEWVLKQDVPGMTVELMKEKGKTPLLFAEIPPTTPTTHTILMYGHMDKQPPTLPWAEGLGPYDPVIQDGKLYGRGGADDGYATCAAITSVQALHKAGLPHGRICIIIEADEESGSPNLPFWLETIAPKLGVPDVVICCDSGTLNYEQLWLTCSLRGVGGGTLTVSLLDEPMHSGLSGGLVPDSFRIARMLLSRVEDEMSGEILVPECHSEVPESFRKEFEKLDKLLPAEGLTKDLPLKCGCVGLVGSNSEMAIANAWKPCMTVIGCSGMPSVEEAGNVNRVETKIALSFRIPPMVEASEAGAAIKQVLEKDPPYGAHVSFDLKGACSGWAAPEKADWLTDAVEHASQLMFNKPYGTMGVGGSIPFMQMLGDMYPSTQFVITGILGPKSNAHGPNEFMHIPYTKSLTACVSSIVVSHHKQFCA